MSPLPPFPAAAPGATAAPVSATRPARIGLPAHMGWFSSDRTIRAYAEDIWHVPVLKT